MSAKLLYSLSDDNPKQLGCINGFLQHFLSGRTVNGHVGHHQKRLPPAHAKMESRDARDQDTKEKSVKNNNKETYSSASSSIPPSQHHARALEERALQGESNTRDKGTKEPKSSINSCQLSIRSSRKQQIVSNVMKHIDSPRLLQPSNQHNQKPSNSTSINTTPPRAPNVKKPHARRLSYDGRESGESAKSASLKLNELPRLSLDSRQGRVRSASVSELKSEFLHQEELGSSRAVSSVVARLMGLEDLLQSTPSIREQQNRSRRSEDVDIFSRSTRSTDESDTDSERHSVSIYREIDKRLGDLDFRKSGKDLRALKHILDAMQRTKSKMETDDNRVSETMNGIKKSQYVNLEQWNGQKSDKGANKPGKVLRSPSKPASCALQQQMPSNLPRVRIGQAVNAKSNGVEKRRAKDSSPNTQPKCGKLEKFSLERRARSAMMTPNQEPKNPTKPKTQSSRQTIEARTGKVVTRKPVQDDQCDLVHTPRPSQKIYKTMGARANVNEESTTIVKEQPSPISVLDADFYDDESLSPVKKKTTVFRDDDASPVSARVEWIAVDTNHLSNSTRSIFSSCHTGKAKETPNNLWLGRDLNEERSPAQAKGPYLTIEDENDFLTRIIAKDLARRSECWTDFSSENSWLVLDIERLLFKDLIVELLHDKESC